MACRKCNSERIVSISGKCSDLFSAQMGETEHDGYVPHDLGIGGGDYIEFSYCLACGQIQDEWPLSISKMEIKNGSGLTSTQTLFAKEVMDITVNSDGDLLAIIDKLCEAKDDIEMISAAITGLWRTQMTRRIAEGVLDMIQELPYGHKVLRLVYDDEYDEYDD